ncbi:hypothetical protein G6F68_014596 [Rhizopus microsporus]|nr:hypothetical protein G6F68_014596 [Rhizopus microsporus]
MRHREIDLQQLPIADLLGVVGDFHGFGVAGAAAADGVVVGGVFLAAGIAGHRAGHALDVLEHGLHAPEAAAGDDGLFLRGGVIRLIDGGRRNDEGGLGRLGRTSPQQAGGGGQGGAALAKRDGHGVGS